ncbi:DUF885 domain-containing protein [Sinosporangium siamense]|uniref:DUF885 domain-containing protein n=1 Tax=Sinosporangium siamense TaxID=1367973 RepID=A0A919RLW5_9ACTN|nr:DUF885 domain-containing protein [Sinosporangium siamense]GII95978.1 hypothetical protein Ssi02_62090 [Sinosporangium siamense]
MGSAGDDGGNARLRELGDDYFATAMAAEPFEASMLGVGGYDALVPDPGRPARAALVGELTRIETALAGIPQETLGEADTVTARSLARALGDSRTELEHGLRDVAVTASIIGPQIEMLHSVAFLTVTDAQRAGDYLSRLGGIGDYLDGWRGVYLAAKEEGRFPVRAGVRQAIGQLDGYLAGDVAADPLLKPVASGGEPALPYRDEAARLVAERVRPALRRLRDTLEQELLPVARGEDEVGVCHIPGGGAAYEDAVRRHTTTTLTPEEIHRIGLDAIARLREEYAEIGGRVFGTTSVPDILSNLRDDQALRFSSSAEMVRFVDEALGRATAAAGDWFPAYDIPACVTEEMDEFEAGNAPAAYYRPPAVDGSRPGIHRVATVNPGERSRFEYEAITFHESIPGHHLQIAVSQTLKDLPDFRRFLGTKITAYVEGWGLYAERLADEMGLYSSDLQRLGMISTDAWRACRLVVDTGLHHFGWTRQQAVAYMLANTATYEANIISEVERYISWPGQALAYMIGRREIDRIRREARGTLGARFDIKEFHRQALGNGALALDVLDDVVTRWAATS